MRGQTGGRALKAEPGAGRRDGGRSVVAVWLALALVAALPLAGHAQERARLLLSGDAVYRTEYVWRGLVRANSPLLQVDGYATAVLARQVRLGMFQFRDVALTAGAWLGFQVRATAADEFGGRSGFGLLETSPWAQLGARAGAVALAAGATRYLYASDDIGAVTRDSTWNTTEIFGTLAVPGTRVSVAATGFVDIEEVKGLYLETGATLNLPLNPIPLPVPLLNIDPMLGNLFLDVTAGWNVSQNQRPDQRANFAGTGLTHLDVAASTGLVFANTVALDASIHVQVSRDQWARLVRPNASQGLNVWFAFLLRPVRGIAFGGER